MKLADVARHLEALAPLALQADYDNAGWICGDPAAPLRGVLFTLDCTEPVVAEAARRGC
ncbi:MAG: Nif3-like dinuclear metal center hexameric protein, partial [Catalinimonas sp.]